MGINEKVTPDVSIKIYPNPVTSNSMLQINNLSGTYDICFYNVLGTTVKKIAATKQTQIPLIKDDFETGIYFYQILTQEGGKYTGKFIVQ